MLWNMFIYAAVNSESDILWLLKLRLSLGLISSVREESLNVARLQRQKSFSYLQLWRGNVDKYKSPGPAEAKLKQCRLTTRTSSSKYHIYSPTSDL